MHTHTDIDTHHLDDRPVGYRSSTGSGLNLMVRARCTCGWAGELYPWSPTSLSEESHDLADHHEATGHPRITAKSRPGHEVHSRCRHRHELDDGCPVPYASPAGLLLRLEDPVLDGHAGAADRLDATRRLVDWADKQLNDAVTGARLNGFSFAAIAELAGITAEEAVQRCGSWLLQSFEGGAVQP